MKVTWNELSIPGLLISSSTAIPDKRGSFTKVLSGEDSQYGSFEGREIFWTQSALGVVRGLHFQLPPKATRKLVFVVQGAIRDFVIDLRVGSPAERELFEVELNSQSGNMIVPTGCAHAYEALVDNTIVCYAQDVPFGNATTYAGIRADSAGIVPRSPTPIITQRDLAFPRLEEFQSPFVYEK